MNISTSIIIVTIGWFLTLLGIYRRLILLMFLFLPVGFNALQELFPC
jgi:hypothetical protein